MVTHSSNRSEDVEVLDYVLQDFLELKADLDTNRTRPFKKFLFSLPLNGCLVKPIEGFILADYLVVLAKRNPEAIGRLIFLNPGNGNFQVKHLGGSGERPARSPLSKM